MISAASRINSTDSMGKICYLSRVKAKHGGRVESGGFDRAALAGPGAKEAESGASQPAVACGGSRESPNT